MSLDKPGIDLRGMAPLLRVYDMETTLHFYCDLLGFQLVDHDNSSPGYKYYWVLLSHQGTEIMFETMYHEDKRPAQPDATRAAHHQDMMLFFGCANVDEAFIYLRDKGVQVDPPGENFYGMRQLYVTDPDGYILCFQWPSSEKMLAAWQERYGKDFRPKD